MLDEQIEKVCLLLLLHHSLTNDTLPTESAYSFVGRAYGKLVEMDYLSHHTANNYIITAKGKAHVKTLLKSPTPLSVQVSIENKEPEQYWVSPLDKTIEISLDEV